MEKVQKIKLIATTVTRETISVNICVSIKKTPDRAITIVNVTRPSASFKNGFSSKWNNLPAAVALR